MAKNGIEEMGAPLKRRRQGLQVLDVTKKQLRVAIYTRVSSYEQVAEGYGLETQERILREYVERKQTDGWIFDERYLFKEEGYSGTHESRPELNRLRVAMQNREIDIVIVWKLDRLFRSVSFCLDMVHKYFLPNKIDLVSVQEQVDITSITGRVMLTILQAFAEMERSMIIERTREGKFSKSRDGYYV